MIRLPLEKSIFWPGSRCLACLQPIRFRHKLPILGYFLTRGRCADCQTPISPRYPLVELLTALAFVALFHLEIIHNLHQIRYLQDQHAEILRGRIPLRAWLFLLFHGCLFALLLAAALCDIDGRVIPLSLTIPGTLVGLIGSICFPWPWPSDPQTVLRLPALTNGKPWYTFDLIGRLPAGLYAWPAWGPWPDWAPPGSWQLGLLTGLAGALTGTLMVRLIKFVFEKGLGKEALGLGDADLMMMAGAFLGWQMVVMGFFLGAFVALFFAIPQALFRGDNSLPFGPGLAIGLMIAWLGWPWIGPTVQFPFFDALMMLGATLFLSVGMFLTSWLMAALRTEDN